MTCTFISDTHGLHDNFTKHLKGGDVLVHAGDCTNRGHSYELKPFFEWLDKLPYTHKIFIAGNHDFIFEDNKKFCSDLLQEYPGIIYLEETGVEIEGIKFWGSPYQPRFFDWAFNVDRGEKIRERWLKIPLDTDVLISHGPPMGILDKTEREQLNVGCQDLMDVINSQLNLKVNVFGHIHEAYGVQIVGETTYINASAVDLRYKPVHLPITLDI